MRTTKCEERDYIDETAATREYIYKYKYLKSPTEKMVYV